MLTTEIINKLLGITDHYQAPQAMLNMVLDNDRRNELFRKFLEHEHDVSYDWFLDYFQAEHAERVKKKQDFTPQCISQLLTSLTCSGNTYFESAVGTGGIMIQYWQKQRMDTKPCDYDPRAYWYQVEELSDRAIPFLIFNMAIRGMNGVIIHGDSLSRQAKDVYFIRNDSANFLGFSEVIKMEHSWMLENELNIKFKQEGG